MNKIKIIRSEKFLPGDIISDDSDKEEKYYLVYKIYPSIGDVLAISFDGKWKRICLHLSKRHKEVIIHKPSSLYMINNVLGIGTEVHLFKISIILIDNAKRIFVDSKDMERVFDSIQITSDE